jgi:osmotically-inducible protein OsmY
MAQEFGDHPERARERMRWARQLLRELSGADPDVHEGAGRPAGHAAMPGRSPRTADDVAASVTAELRWDPRIESRQIVVSAQEGAVVLRGAVGSLREKRDALSAAARVRGVTSVADQLTVLISPRDRPSDADLRADVRQALALNSAIPASLEASVRDWLVTLTGSVTCHYQRVEAEAVCANVPGVLGIRDETVLIPAVSGTDVRHAISAAFQRSARLAMQDLSVDARADGTAILAGTLTSWPVHEEALAAAWSAPGVTGIDDRITVGY